jgi:hypothetical protein
MAVTEILASVDDVNTHLPTDKLDASNPVLEDDVNLYEVDVARFIRAMLAGVFTAVQLASWDSPADTPELIRSIAGRLVAAKLYAVRYAEDADMSGYAQSLYNQALGRLKDIRSGEIVVLDLNDVPIPTVSTHMSLDSADFWPNDSAPPPVFTMDKNFA